MSALQDLREAERRNPESEALDRIAELVSEVFPKGTANEFGRALRHQLHKAGRLNMVRNWSARERLSQSLHAAANLVAGDRDANGIANSVHDIERQLRELHTSEYHR
jgi:hypothetical protein